MKRLYVALILILAVTASGCQPSPVAPQPVTPPPTPGPSTPSQAPGNSGDLPSVTPPPAPVEPSLPESTPGTQTSPDLLISAKQRITLPAAPAADLSELARGNNAFAVDLYQVLQKQSAENLIFSPFSISQALAMTYAGARGQTEQQMAQTLHFSLPQAGLHPAFNALDLALEGQNAGAAQGQFQLNIANSLWGQAGYPFLQAFLDQLAENYGAGMRLTDFVNAPEPARKTINDWVSQQTKDKIKDLIPPGIITPDTRLVLANAIYFYAQWLNPFDANLTRPGDFTLLDGTTTSVSMMSLGHPASLPYAQGDGYQAVELPYLPDAKLAMTLIVPEAGRFAEVQAGLTADKLDALLDKLAPQQVGLTMPKFTYESTFSLADTLGQMGMPAALTPGLADFSGMDGGRSLFISAVVHKAFVAVDEEGTEAAAATAVVVGKTSLPVIDVQLTIDRPFIFIIRDTQTGSILFMGQVVNPK